VSEGAAAPPRPAAGPSLTLRAPPGRGHLLVTREHGRVLRPNATSHPTRGGTPVTRGC